MWRLTTKNVCGSSLRISSLLVAHRFSRTSRRSKLTGFECSGTQGDRQVEVPARQQDLRRCWRDRRQKQHRRDQPTHGTPRNLRCRRRPRRRWDANYTTIGAVFRGGLKNGVLTTVAGTRWRTASTVTSHSSAVPSAKCGAATVASAISFFSDRRPRRRRRAADLAAVL